MKTIKERAFELCRTWETSDLGSLEFNQVTTEMRHLVEEIANAPEPKPVAYQVRNGWVNIALYERQIDAENYAKAQQKRYDLGGSLAHFCVVPLYTAPPTPSSVNS